MQKIAYFCLGLILFPLFIAGAIIETEHLSEILLYLEHLPKDKVLVACDIDNTLTDGIQTLGSCAWSQHLIADLKSKGIPPKQAEQIEHSLWVAVQPHVKVRTIDFQTPLIIQEIQKCGVPIVGLTARSPEEAPCTFAQLKSVDIDFSPCQKQLPKCVHRFANMNSRPLYQHGIIFATMHHKKSEVLFAFLEQFSIDLDYLIFVDDKIHHVIDIEQACQERGIHCIGIRFSGGDERLKQYNPDIAAVQWETFPQIISDDECLRIIQN